jgi:hypothetical protein
MTMTLADVRAEALGVLEEWVDGYTDPDKDGQQHRIRILDSDASSILISAEPHPFGSDQAERFRVHIHVAREKS